MITLEDAKQHLVVEHTEDDDLITALISAVTLSLENITGRAIRYREEALVLDAFAPVIKLPWWPVQTITGITYQDTTGQEQTQANWALDLRAMPARLRPVHGESWPATSSAPMCVTVKAQVGYIVEEESTVPADLQHAAKLLLAHLYQNREPVAPVNMSEVPLTLKYLLQAHVIPRI